MGRISIKWKISDLLFKNIPIPPGMSDDERVCNDCYEDDKKESKQMSKGLKEEKKTEFNKILLDLQTRVPEYKQKWNKNGIVQFKNERMAILQRTWGAQVEFIIACDDLTKEGYRLMAIDEGKTGGGDVGITGGVNAYFYFQKMEFVR